MSAQWSPEWPTEPGWYWTVNHSGRRTGMRPCQVKIAGTAPKTFLVYVLDGEWAERCYYPDILWARAEVPNAPDPKP